MRYEGTQYNIHKITMKELRRTMKRFKRRKTPGPDEIPIEVVRELGKKD